MLLQYLCYVAIIAVTTAKTGTLHKAPECISLRDNGNYYTDKSQCDAYQICNNGEKINMVCPDGLVYKDGTSQGVYPCWNPLDVDCEGRTNLQTPQPTENCDRAWGYFRDNSDCGIYYQCVDGREHKYNCPKGLAFSLQYNQCVWPDQAKECNLKEFLGFECPANSLHNTKHQHLTDCDKFFLCLSGSPRLLNCEYGKIFNPDTGECTHQQFFAPCSTHYSADELTALRNAVERRLLREQERILRLIDLSRKHNNI